MAEEKFVNQAYMSVTESGIGTLTFSKLETGISIYEKVGWLISRLDYFTPILAGQFDTNDDNIIFGISALDSFVAPSLKLSAVIDFNQVARRDFGVAASAWIEVTPFTKSFADLPGGGLLVPPNPIYLFALGAGLIAAHTVQVRMFYTVVKLKVEDFWELVEQRRMIGA